jgi:site-specific DNA-adenine methylase
MKLKTFIKWSGNKSKHLRHLIPYVPKDFRTICRKRCFTPFIATHIIDHK